MRAILGALSLLAIATTGIVFAGIPAEKEVIKLDTMLGTVTFGHKAHATMEGVECTTCHHTYEGEGAPQACSECHAKRGGDAPTRKDALHENCQGCHEKLAAEGKPTGPGKKDCKLCHVKP
jgi:hypothetical protein